MPHAVSESTICILYPTLSPVGEITVLCHFRKNDLMPDIIICKNDKHLVTLYNVIFSNMTGFGHIYGAVSESTICILCPTLSSAGEITVLCNFRKNDLMPVIIICKNGKNLVTLYNVIFSNMTGIDHI